MKHNKQSTEDLREYAKKVLKYYLRLGRERSGLKFVDPQSDSTESLPFKGLRLSTVKMPKVKVKNAPFKKSAVTLTLEPKGKRFFAKEWGWAKREGSTIERLGQMHIDRAYIKPHPKATTQNPYSKNKPTVEKSETVSVNILYRKKPLSDSYQKLFHSANRTGECCLAQDLNRFWFDQWQPVDHDSLKKAIEWNLPNFETIEHNLNLFVGQRMTKPQSHLDSLHVTIILTEDQPDEISNSPQPATLSYNRRQSFSTFSATTPSL
ncbi:MAG: hypothetical protein S4CHLAM102_16490 [Chlamydiia bacterium]|nr:hypothetical protein [Chlamydiia bacterium]